MKTFKDLEFKPHPATMNEATKQELISSGFPKDSEMFKPMTQAKIELNGYTFSVLKGEMFHSNGVDTYEAWAIKYDNAPRGYLTKEEVTDYMKEIQELTHDTK